MVQGGRGRPGERLSLLSREEEEREEEEEEDKEKEDEEGI